MKQNRLESFSDGIFAIVLTLLTFDLKMPQLAGVVTEQELQAAILRLGPIFLSFVLSFALIFTYWRAHNYIISVYAKAVDTRLTSINALFFFFIALVPFSARLLGEYSYTQLSIFIYSLNIMCISVSLLWMRNYVLSSGHISHATVHHAEKRRGVIRIIVPMFCAVAATALSFIDTKLSFLLLAFAIVFNLISRSTKFVNWCFESVKEAIN